jgi:hypothetical protein
MAKLRIHLHRYGGRTMCGRSIDDPFLSFVDDEPRFHDSLVACSTCKRATASDDERTMRGERE